MGWSLVISRLSLAAEYQPLNLGTMVYFLKDVLSSNGNIINKALSKRAMLCGCVIAQKLIPRQVLASHNRINVGAMTTPIINQVHT